MTHIDLVSNLMKPGEQICADLTNSKADVWHMTTGIATEAGELLSTGKAYALYGKPLDRENVIEELGDLEFYMEGLRQVCGITREETLEQNIAKLLKRYNGAKYSNDAAIQRADK